jgi:hypothetical protein
MIKSVLIHRLRQGVINSPKLDAFKTEHFDKMLPFYQKNRLERWFEYEDPNGMFGRISQANMDTFRDRTGVFPHYLKLVPYEPLPEYSSVFNKSFKQIVFDRAKELVATGKKLNVAWSGGLDSTTMLMALLEIADPKQIKVFCSYTSIVESGSLFDTHIRPRGVEYDISVSLVNPTYDDGLILCGYPCDQLFGRYANLQPNEFTMNWRDWVLVNQVPIVEQMLEKFPGEPIVTVPEYLSFIELNIKWEKTKYSRARTLPKHIADRVVNFYENVDFQKWSIGRYEDKFYGTDPKGNKYPLKLILKDFGLEKFAMNKVVQASHYNIIDPDWVMDLQDGRNLYLKDF